jgi:hypothetical protein
VTSRRGPGCPDVIGESSFFRGLRWFLLFLHNQS